MILDSHDKRGSVTVFVCMFFLTMVSMIFAFINASRETAVRSSTETLCNLWAESILAEYDLNLQKRYNIFGFYGYPRDVTEKLDYYAAGSFNGKKYIDYGGSRCSLYDYSLVDVDLFEEQMIKAGKLALTEKFVKPEKEIIKVKHIASSDEKDSGRQKLFDDLPSEGNQKSFSVSAAKEILENVSSMDDVWKEGSDSYFINQYIFSYFKDASDSRGLGKTFFSNEIEYIVCGKHSDIQNQKGIRNKIIAIREGINLLCISRSPGMRAKVTAAAQLITPGPMAAATAVGLTAAWALAESSNDYKLLLAGHKVPLVKGEKAWATDLESVLKNQEEDCIFTGIDEGEGYNDYLRFFTYVMDSRVRTLRIMDLIQINMRHLYYDSFLLREYNGGLQFVMRVNGVDHEMVKKY